MSEGNEAKLVGKLLFGTADILGHLRENEVAATCVEKLIAGIRQSITNRPNGLLKSTKLDLLLPMMMELAKWKEGFTKTDKLRMKFERQGIDIYNRNNLCLPTTEIDVSEDIIYYCNVVIYHVHNSKRLIIRDPLILTI